jgi:hypothetical protein
VGYLEAFANEQQDKTVQAGQAKIYVFTFEQLKPKKAPFIDAI